LLAALALASAASAAFLLASACCASVCGAGVGELEPSLWAGPPTVRGREEVVLGGGAEERIRPGCEKGSGEDSFPQRLPILGNCVVVMDIYRREI